MAEKSKKERVPTQPPGMPQGIHLTGFKGMKDDKLGQCFCGGCHPNAQRGKEYVKVINA